MPSKLKIKMGHIEFEYEGDAQFDKDAIKDLFTHLESLVGITPAAAFDTPLPQVQQPPSAGGGDGGKLNFAPNTVAAKIGASTGGDLLIAAAAYIQLVQERDSFTRKELLEAMQSATTYYKTSMSSNLSKTLKHVTVNGRVNELASGKYSLSAAEQATLKAKLDVN